MFVLCIGMSIARVSVLQVWNKFLLQVVGMQHLSLFFSKLGKNGQLPLLQETWPRQSWHASAFAANWSACLGRMGGGSWVLMNPSASYLFLPWTSHRALWRQRNWTFSQDAQGLQLIPFPDWQSFSRNWKYLDTFWNYVTSVSISGD